MIDYATIGQITVDDTITESGELKRDQTGGGTVYSALGIRLWGHKVGINAVIGHEYPESKLDELVEHDVAIDGILRIPGWSLRLWLLHEENNKKQQFPKLQSSSFAQLDAVRPNPPQSYLSSKGFHITPSTPAGQMRTRDYIRGKRPNALISLDILTEPFINLDAYRTGTAIKGVDVFSPSIVEIEALWPSEPIMDVLKRIADWGVRWTAIKMDVRGSIVHDALKKVAYKLPIYHVDTVDVTGAGDAFSGGFMEGIAETGDVLEAGLRGTVSASYAVENWGAFEMLRITPQDAAERLALLKQRPDFDLFDQ